MKQKYKLIGSLFFFGLSFSLVSAEVFVSEDTTPWLGYSNTCTSAEANHISVTPSSIPTFWSGNTIYDFESGTYNLISSISITEPCTALVGTNDVIIKGNGISSVIAVSSNFTIIKNLTINGNAQDAISLSTTHSNTITNTIIYGSSRGIILTTTTNSLIEDTKLFGNTVGILLLTNSNNNILNNIITFNNSQNGIFINGGSRNTVNNSLSFNNAIYGLVVQAGTQNVFNNSITYNNTSFGIRLIAGNYINQITTLNNNNDNYALTTTGYGSNITSRPSFSAINLKFGLVSDAILGTIGWTNGSMNTGITISANDIFNPYNGSSYLIDTATASGTRKGNKTFGTTLDLVNSKFGSNLPNQIQPVQRNTAGTQLETSTISFFSEKKIGETTLFGGGGSSSSEPVCGNALIEGGEQCDDGNKWNGDGCTATCSIEQPGICGNGILEYKERCDDGNTQDGDSCSSTCQIETGATILNSKQLLQQTALQKTLGVPSALIDTTPIETPAEFILSTITQHQQQQTEQCQYSDIDYRKISFADLSGPYQQQIETLLNYCIIQGKNTGKQRTFGRGHETTYAEFIKVLVKSHFLGSSVDFHNNTFNIKNIYSDVSTGAWYTPYIIKAYVHDLLLPIEKIQGNTLTLSPEKIITKLDAVKLLIHSLKLANKDPHNIEQITDTFKNANEPLTREEMAALMVYGYQLDYNNSLRLRSDNSLLIKLLAKQIQKYPKIEQLSLLKTIVQRIDKLNEYSLKKFNIYKKELLADLATLIDFSEVFLK